MWVYGRGTRHAGGDYYRNGVYYEPAGPSLDAVTHDKCYYELTPEQAWDLLPDMFPRPVDDDL